MTDATKSEKEHEVHWKCPKCGSERTTTDVPRDFKWLTCMECFDRIDRKTPGGLAQPGFMQAALPQMRPVSEVPKREGCTK